MKKIYEYDPKTGEYTSETLATPKPKTPGEYFKRANSTFTPPPETKDNEKAVFEEEKWSIKPDFRGTTYYIRNTDELIETITIKEIGVTVPENAYLKAEDVPKTQAEKASDVRAQRNELIAQADILINKAEDSGKDITALRQYRQALRDLPFQAGFPDTVVWPEVPA